MNQSPRFLLVQLADIGDLILTTPAVAALREAYPGAHIALLTTRHSAPVIEGTGLVNEIIEFERGHGNSSRAFFRPSNLRQIAGLRQGRYDTLVFFHHFTLRLGMFKFALIAWAADSQRRVGLDNGRGWFLTHRLPDAGFGVRHQAQYWLDLVGLLGASTADRPAVIARASGEFGLEAARRPRIVIHAGGGGYSTARRWNPAGFAAVADKLAEEYGAQIVLVGGENDDSAAVRAAMRHTPADLTAKTTLPQLAELLASADLFIGAESGVMHLAAAAAVPVVAVFGPGNPDAWGPWTPEGRQITVRSAPECSPCSYVRHQVGLREGCAARTCMRMVTSQHVLAAARALLDDARQPMSVYPSRPERFPRRVQILDLPVDAITYEEWLALIDDWVQSPSGTPRHVCTINPEFIMIARRDVNFFNILSRADLCVPDGVGLLLASRYLGFNLPERVTGSDGVPKIAARAAESGWRLYFLGAAPGVAATAAKILSAKHPGLQIAGVFSGSPVPDEEDELVDRINMSGADILFVAFGAPEQDKWIARNLPRLQVKMAMGVGGAFDFVAGIVPRAPLWMQRLGLEWLFRLYLQPWRFRRMLRLPRFALAVLLRGR